ncbi:MAG: TonB-dependent receptor [Gemmatimonadetes bacterium]|nr:TonB-dependent receptor [Gemmatimonadota bacterium]
MRAKGLAIVAVLFLPSLAAAQGTLTGTVRDASGGVLPGVTVEAASDALIERVRTAVTDGTGQWRIVDLRPGVYGLTFTLAGFSTVRRDGVELTGTQTLTIPIELRVGAIEETITVTGETPVVDVQNVRREVVLEAAVIAAIPATRAVGALLNATPGLFVGDAGLALSPTMTNFFARSSTINSGFVAGEGRYAVNGFPVTAARSGGFSSYVYDTPNAEEVAIAVGGGLGESDVGGPVMNIIPKSGGNVFRGDAFLNLAGDWSRGENLDDKIRTLNPNLRQTPGIIQSYDTSVSYGGPIKRDRLWFFGSYRDLSTQTAMEGIFANANTGDASRWDWVGSPIEARLVQDRMMAIGRLTGQFGQHRVRVNSEYQHRCEGTPLRVETNGCHNRGTNWIGLGNNTGQQMSPEATSTAARGYFDVPFYVNQGTWTMTASSKLLLEAGYNAFRYQPIFGQPPPDGITDLISATEQSNTINPATGLPYAPVANYRYRSVESWGPAQASTDDVVASASYVTGAHSAKIGYQYRRLDILDKDVANQPQLGYRFNRGVPNAVSYYLPDFGRRTVTQQHGIYIQDSWTRGTMTLQGALRYDVASSFAPPELNGTTNTSWLNPNPINIE